MPRTPQYCIVDHDDLGEAIAVKLPYDPDFVAALKSAIPGKSRRWDPEIKVWFVDRTFEDELFSLIMEYYGDEPDWDDDIASDYQSPSSPRTQAPPANPKRDFSPESAWSTLGLVPTADPDVAKAAYKILSKKWHPDHGGSNEQMTRLNAAWEIIKKASDSASSKEPVVDNPEEDDEVLF